MVGTEQRTVIISLDKGTLGKKLKMPDQTWIDPMDTEVALTRVILPCTWDMLPDELAIIVFPVAWRDEDTNDEVIKTSFFHKFTIDRSQYNGSELFTALSGVVEGLNGMLNDNVDWKKDEGMTSIGTTINPSTVFSMAFDADEKKFTLTVDSTADLDAIGLGVIFSKGLGEILGLSSHSEQWDIHTGKGGEVLTGHVVLNLDRLREIEGEFGPEHLRTMVDVNLEGLCYSYIDGVTRPWLASFDYSEGEEIGDDTVAIFKTIDRPHYISLSGSTSILSTLEVYLTYSGTDKRLHVRTGSQNKPLRPTVQLTFQKTAKEWKY